MQFIIKAYDGKGMLDKKGKDDQQYNRASQPLVRRPKGCQT